MKTTIALAATLVSISLSGMPGLGVAAAPAARGTTVEVRARVVVTTFFKEMNARHYGKVCDLMSVRFYKRNHVPDRKRCVLGLTVGLYDSPQVFFRILGVRRQGDGAVVRALANGAPGKIVLVSESGSLKILEVDGV